MSGAPVSLGRIWAKLCDENHDWSADGDRVDDLPHFGVVIEEAEGEFPVLNLTFENRGVGVNTLVGGRPRVLLSVDRLDAERRRVDTMLMFDGVLDDAADVEFGSEDVVLRYEARRADWEALRDAVLAQVGLPWADPCAGDLSDPVERLDAIPSLVCWSRTTRQPVLSSAIVGGGGLHHDIGRNHTQGKCRVRRSGKPLGRVDVVLTAEWTERRIGEFDAATMIRAAFDNYYGISTYTPERVFNAWLEEGDDLGGYTVSESELYEIEPPAGASDGITVEQAPRATSGRQRTGGIPRVVPRRTRPHRPGAEQPQIVDFDRHWLHVELKVAGAGEVKRKEEVRFSIFNAGQGASTDVEKIEIKLDRLALDAALPDWQPNTHYPKGTLVSFAGFIWRAAVVHDSGPTSLWIDRIRIDEDGDRVLLWVPVLEDGSPLGSPAAQSFFNTARGVLSIDHGIAVGCQRVAYSQRNWEVEIEVDAMEVLGISTRDTMRVVSDVIPGTGGEVVGKVKSYSLNPVDATCSVVLAVSSGSGRAGGTGGHAIAWGPTWSRVRYTLPSYSAPFVSPMGIAKVTVKGRPEDQEAAILQASADGRTVNSGLSETPTSIKIDTNPTGGGETLQPILIAVSPYQGFKGIETQ